MTKPSPTKCGHCEKPHLPLSRLPTRPSGSKIPRPIPKRSAHNDSSSSGTSSERSPEPRSPKKQGCGPRPLGMPPSPSASVCQCRPNFITERDWIEAGSSSSRKPSPVRRLAPGRKPAKIPRLQRKTTAVSGIPRRRAPEDEGAFGPSQAFANMSISDTESGEEGSPADADMEFGAAPP